MQVSTVPASPPADFAPLVEACRAVGISRSVAFELVAQGKLDSFLIGRRRYLKLDSLRALPERLANEQGGRP